jgi:hypothetical protein
MITPILKKNNVEYINESSIFLDLINVDDLYYHFEIYFDFNPELMINDNILNVDFELLDNSLLPSQEFINKKLLQANLPLEDNNDLLYLKKEKEVIEFKTNLFNESVILNKTFNITKSIDNNNKKNGSILKKILKVKNSNELKSYRNLYLNSQNEIELSSFKDSIEYDFLLTKKEINTKFLTFKDSFKIQKNKFNSELITYYLILNSSNNASKIFEKSLNISDIQKFLLLKKDIVEFKVKKQKNLNSIIVRSDTNLNNVKIYKKSLIKNDSKRLIYQSTKDENKIIFNDKSELENVIYRLEFDNQISFNIKEFVINEIKNDYNCIISCHNLYESIMINVNIINNTENDFFILKKRNLSKKQIDYSNVGSIYKNSFSIIDNDVVVNDIYEYSLYHNSDYKKEIGNFVIERNNVKFKGEDFSVSKLIGDDIQFKISYLNSNNNFLEILKNFDLYDQYSQELKTNNNKIKDLFYYKIDRLNKSTGEFVNLGWVTEDFSDKNASKLLNINPANNTDSYNYIITAYNVISSMFLNEEIQVLTDKGRKFLFDKNKWYQPLIIDKSISTTTNTRLKLYGKKDYEFGMTSESIIIDASYFNEVNLKNKKQVFDLSISRKYKNYIILEWNIDSTNLIDHILITKINDNSYEELVDKVSVRTGKNIYFYKIDSNDLKLQFNIIPISNELSFNKRYNFKVIEV